jgi:predicted RNA polymerase sigma factor
VLPRGEPGPFQLQAAIAAIHDEAPTADDTDWPQILALYNVLIRFSDNPVVALNRAVAVAMVHGPAAGLAAVDEAASDQRLAGDHRPLAVRGHLLEQAGDHEGAREAYLAAAERATSPVQQSYLRSRAARTEGGTPASRRTSRDR